MQKYIKEIPNEIIDALETRPKYTFTKGMRVSFGASAGPSPVLLFFGGDFGRDGSFVGCLIV